jgi:predicted dehydrogenase
MNTPEQQKASGAEALQENSRTGLRQSLGPPVAMAVLGTGHRALSLVTRLLQLAEGNVKLILYDESSKALETAQEILSKAVENGGQIDIANDLDEAVHHPGVQWALVASKNYLHKDYCLAALKAGCHVFCEKPLATTIEDCVAIRDAAAEAGRIFMTGFVLRYAQLYSRVKALVDEGFLGKIVSLEANELLLPDHGGYIFKNWRRFKEQSGPHISEKCAHDIDIINWILDSVATKVAAFGDTDIFTQANKAAAEKLQEEESHESSPKLYHSWPAWEDVDPFTSEKSIEDNVVAILQYRNGVHATFHTNCCSALSKRRLLICGVEGTLEADVMKGTLIAKRMSRNGARIEENFHAGMHGGGDGYIVGELREAMTQTAQRDQEATEINFKPKASVEDCFISTITCLAIDEAREKGTVVDLEKYWAKLSV